MLLNSYQNFIGVCGSVSLKGTAGNLPYDARDAFLESLCTFSLTPLTQADKPGAHVIRPATQGDFTLTDKNLQVCKTLLNIAHCLGYLLDVRSWYLLLDCMQRIETTISRTAKYKRQSTRAQPLAQLQAGIEFAEIRQRVQDKMKEYNMLGDGKHQEEEEKRASHNRAMSFTTNKVRIVSQDSW
jgi:hypothetical protein